MAKKFKYERPYVIDVHSDACKGKLHKLLMDEGCNRECGNDSRYTLYRTEDSEIFAELDKRTDERPDKVVVFYWW